MNYIYLGDCLNVLRDNIKDESVDLIYIDPPFNSKRDYNIFFDDKEIQTQRIAFEDTWSLKSIQDSLQELHTMKTENLFYLMLTYQKVAPHAFPYLVMMSLRLIELHRVLKPTGSFYLHCDSNMSHYLKTICDIIFGEKKFRNEIIWSNESSSGFKTQVKKKFVRGHDKILFYSNAEATFQIEHQPLAASIIKRYDKITEDGRRYKIYVESDGTERKQFLEQSKGRKLSDTWTDLPSFQTVNASREWMGYPTQKPKALLERIIKASSNEGDTVLDGFCGCGTTVDAAESLHRNWIGIDISPIAISLIKRRLNNTYGKHLSSFEVRGTPTDEVSAVELWKQNPNAFQDWWLTEFEVFSTTFGSKGADKGIDGIGQYLVSATDSIRVAFQVKGGKVQSKDIDALIGVLSKHKCELGVFLSIEEPTRPMLDTIAQQGFVEFPGFQYPKIQILTLKDFFGNKFPKLPKDNITFKAAQFKGKKSKQIELGI
ncbi:MAG: DNA methyltransferase [Ignavibacteria bacterium]|nr:DNA methyltransferase [Ignavibacteria bacterium]